MFIFRKSLRFIPTPSYVNDVRRNSNDFYKPLPVLSKVLESLVHQKLINLEENRLLYDHQFGFRSKRSTELAVTLLVDKIRKEADKGNITGAIYIDLSIGIRYRESFFITGQITIIMELKILNCFGLLTICFYVSKLLNMMVFSSNTESVSVGVPQGSILGPLLFLILFNDVHKSLMHSQTLIYADDTVIFASHRDINIIEGHLNEDINNHSKWLSEKEQIMNIKKGKNRIDTFRYRQKVK